MVCDMINILNTEYIYIHTHTRNLAYHEYEELIVKSAR